MTQAAVIASVVQADSFPQPAAIYGLTELARRAGVKPEEFRAWPIRFDDRGCLRVLVHAGTPKQILFPQMSPAIWAEIQKGIFRTSTASWMEPPKLALAADLRVPYSSSRAEHVGPLFSPLNRDTVECSVDLPASVALSLGRFEETLPGPRDQHGRYSAFSSIAWRDGFLLRPVVDECALAFAQALAYLLPGWCPAERRLRLKLSHDVDDIGQPFLFRSAIAHALRRKHPSSTVRDLLAPCFGVSTAYQKLLQRAVSLSLARGLNCSVYWKAGAPGPHDRGYTLSDKRNVALRAFFQSRDIEMGIHPSYASFDSRSVFEQEVHSIQEWLAVTNIGGRQDYLRWNPDTWFLWESMGLAYDASVGFADHVGFRAGTCHPYRPWLFSQNREANLLEIPLVAMDTTVLHYMHLRPSSVLRLLLSLVSICRAVGGVFTLVWHHTNLMLRQHARTYSELLDHLVGTPSFDWKNTHFLKNSALRS